MVRTKKTQRKQKSISTQPLTRPVRNPRGEGRRPVAAIMVSKTVKERFESFKMSYISKFGSATNDQIITRWMDGLEGGAAFDVTIAKLAAKRHRAALRSRKGNESAAET